MSDRPAHWLRRNEALRYPRRLVCLDTEAAKSFEPGQERHRLRCAVASMDVVEPGCTPAAETAWTVALDPGELWSQVDRFTRSKERTVLFAHNLGYDLRLSAALRELPLLGWQLTQFSLDSYRCWLRWRRGERTLLMVDTMSFVGRGLGHFAAELGVNRRPLPDERATLEDWVGRCRSDVELLRALVLRLLGWLEQGEHGNFRMTGPAQATASFRHRFLDHKRLLVHNDRRALGAERESCYSGRCELWQHGRVDGLLQEWDFEHAYARIALNAELPVRYRGSVEAPRASRVRDARRWFSVLAECDVDTVEPLVPTRLDGRILWPTGSFRSLLWDCELGLLDEHGADYRVRRIWLYQKAPLLRRWASWILEQLERPDGQLGELERAVLKGWSRSLIGRFGLRYPRWQQAGETPDSELLLLPYVDGDGNPPGTFLRLGRQLLEQAGTDESRDSAPAVMAWIMAQARVRLWQAMLTAGLENVVYVDTDSVVTTREGSRRLDPLTAAGYYAGLRVKAEHDGALLHSPRQVVFGSSARIAGLPRTARRLGPRRFEAEVWEGVSEAVRHRRADEVLVHSRTVSLRGVDRRRRHLAGGRTAAYTLTDGAGGYDHPNE